MEKTTKKRKGKKGLKKRIGLIAIGGLSLVLTVCLSVGATLAWFAGSTHASKSLYMGGPVYVEMQGRGDNTGTNWQGGTGKLDITSFKRGVGTVKSTGVYEDNTTDVLLPGQGFAIYSQARVYSTSATTSVGTDTTPNESSGADTTNTSTGEHLDAKGRKTTTTTSVLRARFSISVEFDPTVGFNNFTKSDYAGGYPKQSEDTATVPGFATVQSWAGALNAEKVSVPSTTEGGSATDVDRRDKVTSSTFTDEVTTKTELEAIKAGTKKSIYSWKFVSKDIYNGATTVKITTTDGGVSTTPAETAKNTAQAGMKYVQMGAPFDGTDKSENANGYYGVWILDDTTHMLAESDAFYKARTNAYLQRYVEHYPTEYSDYTRRTIGDSLAALETALNNSFINLVNDSSDAIIAGYINGMKVDEEGVMTYETAVTGDYSKDNAGKKASWLYIDPTIGNDTNTNELATGTGGWWYLVECDGGKVNAEGDAQTNRIYTASDHVYTKADFTGDEVTDITGTDTLYPEGVEDTLGNVKLYNNPTIDQTTTNIGTTGLTRKDANATNEERLTAKLFEIAPKTAVGTNLATNGTTENLKDVKKVISYAFPFVNGRAVLEGDALTNIFANAKISVQISFQAIQAFFPYSTNIDGIDYKNTLLGTEKALTIGNAIPIFNEAFDYSESYTSSNIGGL